MRNAAVTTIAPTGTLSILSGCSGGIEPVFALAFYRHVLNGRELFELNGPFRRMLEQRGMDVEVIGRRLAEGEPLSRIPGLDDRVGDVFVTAHQIASEWHVRMQAVFQEYIDGAISKTINLPNSATPPDINEIYRLAYDLKCKGVTVYRDGCRAGQPMAILTPSAQCPHCHGPLADDGVCCRCLRCGCTLCS